MRDEQKERHDEAINRFSQFRYRAKNKALPGRIFGNGNNRLPNRDDIMSRRDFGNAC